MNFGDVSPQCIVTSWITQMGPLFCANKLVPMNPRTQMSRENLQWYDILFFSFVMTPWKWLVTSQKIDVQLPTNEAHAPQWLDNFYEPQNIGIEQELTKIWHALCDDDPWKILQQAGISMCSFSKWGTCFPLNTWFLLAVEFKKNWARTTSITQLTITWLIVMIYIYIMYIFAHRKPWNLKNIFDTWTLKCHTKIIMSVSQLQNIFCE